MKDLFLNNKVKGCEIQLEKLESKLVVWEGRSAVLKLVMMNHIKKLQQEQKSYEKMYNRLKAQQIKKETKKMHRVALTQDALYEIKTLFN